MRLVLLAVCSVVLGCRSTGPNRMPTEQEQLDMLALMLPQRIQIQPFTKIKSFNDDDVPDGILAVVRPLDKFGDPVKAVGLFYFELWTYVNASGMQRGERLAFWEREITTAEEVRLYWTRAEMYEFQLAWTAGVEAIQPGRKFVLTATYRAPWDETFQDEYVIDFQLPPGLLTPAAPRPE
ncbi:MAG TPA: hypothetical protein PL151_04250 [Phycisphaerae bacterium]|nr:hypothetical protein [Phycisphaerae bacterium]HOJ74414.1 hypothetical protein [Phycisphaerae bacterium]HOM52903.1 hypothetical protein [Phycisphaerae bacterium]HON67915.1 hypothetical protein [Phycisphaerae bacterium]HOQ85750.1 hypothetical protein [Phycisphaerae bacterium]